MTDAARYVKVVEWSEEDGAFVGQCPGIIGPCCHGPDEVEVYRESAGSSRSGSRSPTATGDRSLRRPPARMWPGRSPESGLAPGDRSPKRSGPAFFGAECRTPARGHDSRG